jgi:hypothetical protein
MNTKTENATKCCSKCGLVKNIDKFHKSRRVCSGCRQILNKEKYQKKKEKTEEELLYMKEKECHACHESKDIHCFIKCTNICKDCNNEYRRERYKNDETFRSKHISDTCEHKHKKVLERRKQKEEEIGIGNKKCNYCSVIKPEERFRHNRLKCRDCERDDPKDKFNRAIRCRIYLSLKKKDEHTIDYLGCNYDEYHRWILNHDYNLENRGEWHIDHVIPLSSFNLDNKEEQYLAFNWRNTTPLPVKENLSKNKKILTTHLEKHWNKLISYHHENNIELPQVFVDLFAKYLVAGTPLEPSLPLTNGNVCEELG